MLFYTEKARLSAIADIRKKISVVMSMKNGEMSYTDARGIVDYLLMMIDQIEAEQRDVDAKATKR